MWGNLHRAFGPLGGGFCATCPIIQITGHDSMNKLTDKFWEVVFWIYGILLCTLLFAMIPGILLLILDVLGMVSDWLNGFRDDVGGWFYLLCLIPGLILRNYLLRKRSREE